MTRKSRPTKEPTYWMKVLPFRVPMLGSSPVISRLFIWIFNSSNCSLLRRLMASCQKYLTTPRRMTWKISMGLWEWGFRSEYCNKNIIDNIAQDSEHTLPLMHQTGLNGMTGTSFRNSLVRSSARQWGWDFQNLASLSRKYWKNRSWIPGLVCIFLVCVWGAPVLMLKSTSWDTCWVPVGTQNQNWSLTFFNIIKPSWNAPHIQPWHLWAIIILFVPHDGWYILQRLPYLLAMDLIMRCCHKHL